MKMCHTFLALLYYLKISHARQCVRDELGMQDKMMCFYACFVLPVSIVEQVSLASSPRQLVDV